MTRKLCALLLAALPWASLAAAEPGGIGLSLGRDKLHLGDYQEILKVLPGGPADLAGLRTDDRITHINYVSCRGKTWDEVAALLRVESGTEVIVEVRRIFQDLAYRIKRQLLPTVSYADRLTVKYPERRLCDYIGAHGGLSDLSKGDFKCYGGSDYPERQQNCWFRRRYIRKPGPEQAQEVKDLLTELSDTILDCPDWIADPDTHPDSGYPDFYFLKTRDGKLRMGLGVKADEPHKLAVSLGPVAPLMAAPTPKPAVQPRQEPPAQPPAAKAAEPDLSPMMGIVYGMQKAKAEQEAASKVQAADAAKSTPPDEHADGYIEGPPIVHSRAWFSVEAQGAYTEGSDIQVPPGSGKTRKLYFRYWDEGYKALQASQKPQAVLKFFPRAAAETAEQLYLRGKELYDRKDYAGTIRAMDEVIKLKPGFRMAYIYAGRAVLDKDGCKSVSAAERYYDAADKIAPALLVEPPDNLRAADAVFHLTLKMAIEGCWV